MKTPTDDDLIARIAAAEARLAELSRKTLSTLAVSDPASATSVLTVQPDTANGGRPQITIRDTTGNVLFQNDTGGTGWGLRAPLRMYNGSPTGLTVAGAYGSDTTDSDGYQMVLPTTSQKVRIIGNAYIHNASLGTRVGTYSIFITFNNGSSYTTIDTFTISLPTGSPGTSNASQLRDITYTFPSNVYDQSGPVRVKFMRHIDSNPSGVDGCSYIPYLALAVPA